MKTILKIIVLILLTPILMVAMWIHDAYKLWFYKKRLKEISQKTEKPKK